MEPPRRGGSVATKTSSFCLRAPSQRTGKQIARFSKSKCRCPTGSREFWCFLVLSCLRVSEVTVVRVRVLWIHLLEQRELLGACFLASKVTPQGRWSPFFVSGQRGQEDGIEGVRSSRCVAQCDQDEAVEGVRSSRLGGLCAQDACLRLSSRDCR